jgi:hypothetical protein
VPLPKTGIIFRKKDYVKLDIAARRQRIENRNAVGRDDFGEDDQTARHSAASR